jgi:hypothetical protein
MVHGKSPSGLVGPVSGMVGPATFSLVALSKASRSETIVSNYLLSLHLPSSTSELLAVFRDPLTIFAKLISPYVSIMSSSTPPPSASPSEASKPLDAPIMPADRSLGRDVFIYDAKDPDEALGGLILTNGVTNANLYSMVEIIIIFRSGFSLLDDDGTKINRDYRPLSPGNYFIDADGKLLLCTLYDYVAN